MSTCCCRELPHSRLAKTADTANRAPSECPCFKLQIATTCLESLTFSFSMYTTMANNTTSSNAAHHRPETLTPSTTPSCCPPCVHTYAGQLLSVALQHEQPELESRKAQLLQKEAGLTLQLAALEKQLLQALATSRLVSQLDLKFVSFCYQNVMVEPKKADALEDSMCSYM